jgi:hypothetical protein
MSFIQINTGVRLYSFFKVSFFAGSDMIASYSCLGALQYFSIPCPKKWKGPMIMQRRQISGLNIVQMENTYTFPVQFRLHTHKKSCCENKRLGVYCHFAELLLRMAEHKPSPHVLFRSTAPLYSTINAQNPACKVGLQDFHGSLSRMIILTQKFCNYTHLSSCVQICKCVAQTVVSDYRLDDRGSNLSRGKGLILLISVSRPALRPMQPPAQWVPEGHFPCGKAWLGVTLTIHPHLVLRLMSRSYTHLPYTYLSSCIQTWTSYKLKVSFKYV